MISRGKCSTRNSAIQRQGFVEEAYRLLPHSAAAIEKRATELYGLAGRDQPEKGLIERLERRLRFYQTLGSAFEVDLSGEVQPDGDFDHRLLLVLREAAKLGVTTSPMVLKKDGIELRWSATGFYRICRAAVLPPAVDDGTIGQLWIAQELMQRGGLFKVERMANGYRLAPPTFPAWRLLLRLLRQFQGRGRGETLRRYRDGQRFNLQRLDERGCKAVLLPGRLPSEVGKQIHGGKAVIEARLERVRSAVERILVEGASEARHFARDPDVVAANAVAARTDALTQLDLARQEVMRSMEIHCYKAEIPDVAPADIPQKWPRMKPASRPQRKRHLWAIERFETCVAMAKSLGWQPISPAAPICIDRKGQVLMALG